MTEQREKLIELFEWHYDVSHELTVAGIENLADYLIANGVVVLPCRCKDCAHARKLNDNFDGWEYSCMYFNTHATTGNDFCSYAKTKRR